MDELQYGSVLCVKCSHSRRSAVCPRCGYTSCWVRLRWHGTAISIWHSADGKPLTYKDAGTILVKLNDEIEKNEFDPARYSKKVKNEKSVDALWDQFVTQKEKVWSPGTASNARSIRKAIEPLADLVDLATFSAQYCP